MDLLPCTVSGVLVITLIVQKRIVYCLLLENCNIYFMFDVFHVWNITSAIVSIILSHCGVIRDITVWLKNNIEDNNWTDKSLLIWVFSRNVIEETKVPYTISPKFYGRCMASCYSNDSIIITRIGDSYLQVITGYYLLHYIINVRWIYSLE